MEAKELRIGNLIYFSSPEDVYKITAINANSDETATIEGIGRQDCDGTYDCSGLSPLPLSDEWLLKFGFDKEVNPQYNSITYRMPYSFNYKREPVAFIRIVDFEYRATGDFFKGYLFPLTDGEYFMSQKYIEITYVNHLQNLCFALTGKELTIKESTLNNYK